MVIPLKWSWINNGKHLPYLISYHVDCIWPPSNARHTWTFIYSWGRTYEYIVQLNKYKSQSFQCRRTAPNCRWRWPSTQCGTKGGDNTTETGNGWPIFLSALPCIQLNVTHIHIANIIYYDYWVARVWMSLLFWTRGSWHALSQNILLPSKFENGCGVRASRVTPFWHRVTKCSALQNFSSTTEYTHA